MNTGGRIITADCIIGIIANVLDENELEIEISEGVRVKIMCGTNTDRLPTVAKSSSIPCAATSATPAQIKHGLEKNYDQKHIQDSKASRVKA